MVGPENCLRCDCNFLSCRRPDYCLGPHLRQMLSYGCTRLEIGVQSTYEDVARDTNRGHTVAAVADCFCLAKDAGFKVSLVPYHISLHWWKNAFGPFYIHWRLIFHQCNQQLKLSAWK